jgi:site-specific DNA-cytosine methylase
MSSRPTAVAAHVFAGGFSLGVRDRFDVRAHLETSSYGGDTCRHNFPGVDVRVSPTGAWPTDDLVGADLVFSNPPCALWSSAGARGGVRKRDYALGYDPRDGRIALFQQAFGLLARLRPCALVIESVLQSWARGRPFLDPLIAVAAACGYGCDVVFHDAYDCGAPQHRKRVVYVFTRVAIPWARPAVSGPRTVGEALAGVDPGDRLQPLRPSEAECLARTPPGGKLNVAYDSIYGDSRLGELRPGQRAGKPSFLDLRLDLAKPAPTCVGGFHYYHPTEARHLTIRETQVLCGYPSTYEFTDRLDTCYRQIAQAVMPPVGRWLANVIADALDANAPRGTGLRSYDLINNTAATVIAAPTLHEQEGPDMTKLDQNVVDRALRKAVEMRLWLNHRSADAITYFLGKAVDAYEREAQMGFRVLQDYDEPEAPSAAVLPFNPDPPTAAVTTTFTPTVAAPLSARVAAPPPARVAAPPPTAPQPAPPPARVVVSPPAAPQPALPPARVAAPPAWPVAAPPAPVASPVEAAPAKPPTKPAPELPEVSAELVEYFRPKDAAGATKPRAAAELIRTMLQIADEATGTCAYTDLEIAATARAAYPDLGPLVYKYPGEARYRLKKQGLNPPPPRV